VKKKVNNSSLRNGVCMTFPLNLEPQFETLEKYKSANVFINGSFRRFISVIWPQRLSVRISLLSHALVDVASAHHMYVV
jgi:hypothetical protein